MGEVTYVHDIGELGARLAEISNQPQLLVLPDFITTDVARDVRSSLSRLIQAGQSSIYGSSALPLYEFREAANTSLEYYLSRAAELLEKHRALLEPYGHPLERFMSELSSVTSMPVERLEIFGKPCFFGQFRCFSENESVLPHVDVLQMEFPTAIDPPLRQWALNLMISPPISGGELEIWDVPFTELEYRGYGMDRPGRDPWLRFQPHVGDLYLFQSTYLHAICASEGSRCTLSGFLAGPWHGSGYRVWS